MSQNEVGEKCQDQETEQAALVLPAYTPKVSGSGLCQSYLEIPKFELGTIYTSVMNTTTLVPLVHLQNVILRTGWGGKKTFPG